MSKLVARKTQDLEGAELDWAVAQCEGHLKDQTLSYWNSPAGVKQFLAMRDAQGSGVHWVRSSTDWSEGGAIIENENINLIKVTNGPFKYVWAAMIEYGQQAGFSHDFDEKFYYFTENELVRGPTPLIAAMRCYVQSKLGAEIKVPEGLQSASTPKSEPSP
jgi:hypothetical protein